MFQQTKICMKYNPFVWPREWETKLRDKTDGQRREERKHSVRVSGLQRGVGDKEARTLYTFD